VANRIEDIRANNPSLLVGARNVNDIKVRAEEVDLFASVADRLYNDEVRRYAKLPPPQNLWVADQRFWEFSSFVLLKGTQE